MSESGATNDENASEAGEGAAKHGALGHLSEDEEVQQAVCSALIENTALDSSKIGVRVTHEAVILSGTVKSAEAWRLALTVAREQAGALGVLADELQVTER